MAALALLAAMGSAGAAATDDARWYVQMDNDVFTHTDRWYTSGLRIARLAPDGDGAGASEWGLAQEVYTPDTKHFELFVVDRPPAGRLLLSYARHLYQPGRYRTLELAGGVRGPAARGEQTTELIHRIISAREVEWSRQAPNRFDGHAALTDSRDLASADTVLHYGVVAGTQVAFAHAGAEYRFGNRGFTSSVLRFIPTPPPATAGWGGFVGASVRLVGRNRLLTPGYDPFAPDPRLRRAIARVAGGVAWARPGLTVSLGIAWETREFIEQRVPHAFGAFAASFDF